LKGKAMALDLVLITGVNGYVGFKVLRKALEAGYRVRATIRREEMIENLKNVESIKPHLDKIEFVVIKDLAEPTAFHGVLDGVAYALHVASPIPRHAGPEDDVQVKLIDATVQA
jgi:uncharacterized protein YbjT (DUF2867 family)